MQRQYDTVNLTPPCKYPYNACKYISCKIIHAMHAKQGETKSEQSRRKLRNKTTVFIKQLLFIQVTERKTQNKLYGGATTKK
jgi:hypothetical protein